jgi:hypothetical protein
MKPAVAAVLTALTVCVLFVSTGGILLWSLSEMLLSVLVSMVEYFNLIPIHWADENRLTIAAAAGLLTLPVVLYFGFRLYRQALKVERGLHHAS